MTTGQRKKRVLIVDDEVAVGNMLAACCDMWEMEPIVATTGAEALSIIAGRAPDLIVTDFMMPGMSGHDLCRAVRADARLGKVPLILMSAVPEAAEPNSPADAFLPKPLDIDRAEETLRHWLKGANGVRRRRS